MEPILSNRTLAAACFMIGLPIAFVLGARLCRWLQNRMINACKPDTDLDYADVEQPYYEHE